MRNNRGLSLIEVIVAVAILAGALTAIYTMVSGNSLRIRKSRTFNEVGFLLERKITEIELQYEGKPIGSIPEEESGDFGKDYPGYRWEFKSQEFSMPDLKNIYMAGNSDGLNETLGMVLTQMQQYFSSAVVEATVSIYVKIKDKEAQYSVTTYFVDYNQTFSLGGGGQ